MTAIRPSRPLHAGLLFAGLAVVAIAQLSNESALGQMLYADDFDTQLEAARRLAAAGEDGLPMLLDARGRADPGVATASTVGLARMRRADLAGVEALHRALLLLLDDDRPEAAYLAQALADFGGDAGEALPALERALASADAFVRMDAAQAIVAIGGASYEGVTAAVAAVVDILSWDAEWFEVLPEVPVTLARLGAPAMPAIVALLADAEGPVLHATVSAIPLVGPEASEAESLLVGLLDVREMVLRVETAAALLALGATVDPASRRKATEVLEQGARSPLQDIRDRAEAVLGRPQITAEHLLRYPAWRSDDGIWRMFFATAANGETFLTVAEHGEGQRTGVAMYVLSRGELRCDHWLTGLVRDFVAVPALAERASSSLSPLAEMPETLVLRHSDRHVSYVERMSAPSGGGVSFWNTGRTVPPGTSRTWEQHPVIVVAADGTITQNVRIHSGPGTSYQPVDNSYYGGTVIPSGNVVHVLARTTDRQRIGEWDNFWMLVEIPSATATGKLQRVWLYGEFVAVR